MEPLDASHWSSTSQSDQHKAGLRDEAENFAFYYRTLTEGGIPTETAELMLLNYYSHWMEKLYPSAGCACSYAEE